MTELYQAQRVLAAYEVISTNDMGLIEAEAIVSLHKHYNSWLAAERGWNEKVRRWLEAEGKWKASQVELDSPSYARAKAGWEAMRVYVPHLDGVPRFEALPQCMKFRYATFAAAVLGVPGPDEVKSSKQETAEYVATHYGNDGIYGRSYYGDFDSEF